MIEVRLHTLLVVLAAVAVLMAAPFVVRWSGERPVHAAAQVLPTPTPVPLQGLSERARLLAQSLITPTPEALPTPLPPTVTATVRTNGADLNIRSGPGLDYTVIGSAPNGLALTVTGLSPDRQWLRVAIPAWTQAGWVYAPLTDMEGNLAALPIAGGE